MRKYAFLKEPLKCDEGSCVYKIMLYQRFALPITTLVFTLLGIPLAITPPRVRYNRGFLLSIGIIFIFYVIRAFAMPVLGESGLIPPMLAVWLPNIILGIIGLIAYRNVVYRIK